MNTVMSRRRAKVSNLFAAQAAVAAPVMKAKHELAEMQFAFQCASRYRAGAMLWPA